jgi:hypothetical protein
VNAADNVVPSASAILSKQARGRIPWAVFAIEQPAPIRDERRQGQCPGKVSDACIHRDHEIKIRDEYRARPLPQVDRIDVQRLIAS